MSASNAVSLVPSIIVMKGYPFTRKTEIAEVIAKSLKCPLLSLEDVLKRLTPPLSPEKEFEAFQVICEIAIHHLHRSISRSVVIDSPLSSQSHFIHLLNCISCARVIVIECKPVHTYSWKLKFEDYSIHGYFDKEWYKPQKWEDVEKAIQQHPDYDVTSLSSTYRIVLKLVVDPILDCPDAWYYDTQSGLVEAVKYMMRRGRGDGPDVVIYRQWLQKHIYSSSSSSSPPLGEEHCRRHGHDIFPNSTAVKLKGNQHETVGCMVCRRQVMRSNDTGHEYCYCKNCSLTLHMECALLCDDDTEISSQESYACKPCKKGVSDKSISYRACEFNNHIPIGLPLAIKHFDTSEHFLTILLASNKEANTCFACGNYGDVEMYLCKDCGVTYDYDCLTRPRRVKNVHGGHHHHLSLKFESEEAEDYLCQECQELRDPMLWYYSCEHCPGYELHPNCVAKLMAMNEFTLDREWMDKAEIAAAVKFNDKGIEMKESESISGFYSRVIYLIQWYGRLWEEVELVGKILRALPLKFYHIVVAIKRSEEYESMTVDQLMITLHVYEKRIDNGEDVLIELVLANLYATQRSSYKRGGKYYRRKSQNLIMNAEDVTIQSVLDTDYSKQESGGNWVKYWGKYWDNYWFNYQRGFYSSEDKSKVQCSICYMFGHGPRHCWKASTKVKKKPLKIKINLKIEFKCLIQSHSS